MKKIVLLINLILLLVISGCGKRDELTIISKDIGVNLPNASIESIQDSHSGFHNDGCKQAVIQLDENFDINEITTNERWNILPLTDNIYKFLYRPYTEEIKLPTIENGYFYFKDIYEDTKIRYYDTMIFERASFNFTVAIYDSVLNKMYYIKYDS